MMCRPPELLIAADWSVNAQKRWMAIAKRGENGKYAVHQMQRVGDLGTLLTRVGRWTPDGGTALLGFDFPIGLPRQYAEKAGITSFKAALREFGRPGPWEDYFTRTEPPRVHQPFSPQAVK